MEIQASRVGASGVHLHPLPARDRRRAPRHKQESPPLQEHFQSLRSPLGPRRIPFCKISTSSPLFSSLPSIKSISFIKFIPNMAKLKPVNKAEPIALGRRYTLTQVI